jgi:hypothetical protein
MLADMVPDFPQACGFILSVTPNNGSPAVSAVTRILYQNSALTVGRESAARAAGPGVAPQATPATISVGQSLTISHIPDNSFVYEAIGLQGTVTYSVGGTVLGSDVAYGAFPISGATLGVGIHTITVTYAIWHEVAFAPFSRDVTVEVTG